MAFILGALGSALGHASRIGITATSLRSAGGTFAQSLPFGAGYSLGTYLGFPKNYQNSTTNFNRTQVLYLNRNSMPYGRKIRVWSRRLRRYVWVYPRRTFRRKTNYYRRRY